MKNPRKVIAVDIDRTLCDEVCFTPKQVKLARPRKDRIEKHNKLLKRGFVVIYTARRRHLVPATLDWLEKHGVKFHAFQYGILKMPFDEYYDNDAKRL